MVGFGAGLFLPWAFMFQFVYHQGLFAVVALALGALLLLIGGLGWVGETIGVIQDEGWSPAAMLMFIGTEVMTLLGLLAGYWTMRLQAPEWPPAGTPEIHAPYLATLILIASSFTIAMARRRQMAGDAGGFARMTLVSAAIWAVFAYMTISLWGGLTAQGFKIGSNALGTDLYGMTGIHFAHIVFGLLIMLLALPPAFKGRLSASYARAMTTYVHFVNVLGVWVLLQVFVW
jgi:cytochrome c oxidase subunit 3